MILLYQFQFLDSFYTQISKPERLQILESVEASSEQPLDIPPPNVVPWYRLNCGFYHLYTHSIDDLSNNFPRGCNMEGIQGYVFRSDDPKKPEGTIPLFRLHNFVPSAGVKHYWTVNELERDNLVSQGWTNEGPAANVYPSQQPGTVPMYILLKWPDHLYTTSKVEADNAVNNLGYTYANGGNPFFYVYPSGPTAPPESFRQTPGVNGGRYSIVNDGIICWTPFTGSIFHPSTDPIKDRPQICVDNEPETSPILATHGLDSGCHWSGPQGYDKNASDPEWVPVSTDGVPYDLPMIAEGKVTKSDVAHYDWPYTHNSHDQNFKIELNKSYKNLLSTTNDVGILEPEWEIGIDDPNFRGLPRFAFNFDTLDFPEKFWPSEGDQVWAMGRWIFDCGHGFEEAGLRDQVGEEWDDHPADVTYKTELHPLYAIASSHTEPIIFPGDKVPSLGTLSKFYFNNHGGYFNAAGMPLLRNYEYYIKLPEDRPPNSDLVTATLEKPFGGPDPDLTPYPAKNPQWVRVTIPLEPSDRQFAFSWSDAMGQGNEQNLRSYLKNLIQDPSKLYFNEDRPWTKPHPIGGYLPMREISPFTDSQIRKISDDEIMMGPVCGGDGPTHCRKTTIKLDSTKSFATIVFQIYTVKLPEGRNWCTSKFDGDPNPECHWGPDYYKGIDPDDFHSDDLPQTNYAWTYSLLVKNENNGKLNLYDYDHKQNQQYGAIVAAGWKEEVPTKGYRLLEITFDNIKVNDNHSLRGICADDTDLFSCHKYAYFQTDGDPYWVGVPWRFWVSAAGHWLNEVEMITLDNSHLTDHCITDDDGTVSDVEPECRHFVVKTGDEIPINRSLKVLVPQEQTTIPIRTTGWKVGDVDHNFGGDGGMYIRKGAVGEIAMYGDFGDGALCKPGLDMMTPCVPMKIGIINEPQSISEVTRSSGPSTPPANVVPFYRLWCFDKHFYTLNRIEAIHSMNIGCNMEGIEGYVFHYDDPEKPGTIPLFRLYTNIPFDGVKHYWTVNEQERDDLKSLGWTFEGPAANVYPSQLPGTVPMYILLKWPDHLYTTSKVEADNAVNNLGYTYANGGNPFFYVYPSGPVIENPFSITSKNNDSYGGYKCIPHIGPFGIITCEFPYPPPGEPEPTAEDYTLSFHINEIGGFKLIKVTTKLINEATGLEVDGSTPVPAGQSIHDTTSFEFPDANGKIDYLQYDSPDCSGTPTSVSSADVANSIAPTSAPYTYTQSGTFSWKAHYTNDLFYYDTFSQCEPVKVVSIKVEKQFVQPDTSFTSTPPNLGTPLLRDSSGDYLTKVVLTKATKDSVASTNPGQVDQQFKIISDEGNVPIKSITSKDTLPINWILNPSTKPPVVVLFKGSNTDTYKDITKSATVNIAGGTNPTTNEPGAGTRTVVTVQINDLTSSKSAGKAFEPGDEILVYVKTMYGLKGYTVDPNKYPISDSSTSQVSANSEINYGGITQGATGTANLKVTK